EKGVVLDQRIELTPHLELAIEILGDRLDHEIAVGEIRVLERRGDPCQDSVSLRLLHPALLDRPGELLLDLAHALIQLPLIDFADHDVPTLLSADLRDPMPHEPAAQDPDLANRHMRCLPLYL